MVRSHYQLDGYESEQTPADSEGQGNCYAVVHGVAESETTQQSNNNNNNKNNTYADPGERKKTDDAGNREEQICSYNLEQARGYITASIQGEELHLEQSKGVWLNKNIFPRNDNHL